jgi:hypothetical protein
MAKSMTNGLQNSTHVSKLKWADPKLVVVMKTKDKTLFILACPFAVITLAQLSNVATYGKISRMKFFCAYIAISCK